MKKKKEIALTVCGCDCRKCYCTEGACAIHPHCFGKKCKLFSEEEIEIYAMYGKDGLRLKWSKNPMDIKHGTQI